jgi:hypothetical protein
MSYYVKRRKFEWLAPSWTGPIRASKQADKEASAWRDAGWLAEVIPSSVSVRREVNAWQRQRNLERASA